MTSALTKSTIDRVGAIGRNGKVWGGILIDWGLIGTMGMIGGKGGVEGMIGNRMENRACTYVMHENGPYHSTYMRGIKFRERDTMPAPGSHLVRSFHTSSYSTHSSCFYTNSSRYFTNNS